MTLAEQAALFAQSVSIGKGRIHPCPAVWVDGCWLIQDDPPRGRDPRRSTVVVAGVSPTEAAERVAASGVGWHVLDILTPPLADLRALRKEVRAAGYRSMGSYGCYAHDLRALPTHDSDPPVRAVESAAVLAAIPQCAPQPRKWYADATTFCVWDSGTDYGWVEVLEIGDVAWVRDMYVFAPFRGRGFGRALMAAALAHASASGLSKALLIASKQGARLYSRLGFEQVGTLHSLCVAR